MKTLYALVLLCLSAPALAWEPESYNIACPDDGLTLSAIEPATQNYDYSVDTSIDYDDHTATVASPASQPTTDAPVDPIINFFDDEGIDFTVPAAIEHAIQASDWW